MTAKNENQTIGQWIIFVAVLSIISAPCVLIFQCYEWLRLGEWQPISLLDAYQYLEISYPTSSWGGVQRIIDWLTDCSFSGFLFFAGLVIACIGLKICESDK